MPSAPTVFHTFESCAAYRNNPAFIYRAGKDEQLVTYEKFFEDVLLLARGFKTAKIRRGDKVFLLSDNRYAWIVTDMALQSLGAVSVPRGCDTPALEIEYIVTHSQCDFLIFETDKIHDALQPLIKKLHPKSVFIIAGEERSSWFEKAVPYSKLLEDRTIEPQDMEWFKGLAAHITPDDLLTIIYTSGTTGTPKGVMLSHANIMHNVRTLPPLIELGPDDLWLSILPTWHIFERAAEYISIASGSSLVYSSIRTFAADLENYKPTLVATVPRLWEALYSRITTGLKKKDPKRPGFSTCWCPYPSLSAATGVTCADICRFSSSNRPCPKRPENAFRVYLCGPIPALRLGPKEIQTGPGKIRRQTQGRHQRRRHPAHVLWMNGSTPSASASSTPTA